MSNTNFAEISLANLDLVTGGGQVNWGNAAAQCGIWGVGGAAAAAVTGVGAPAALGAGAIGCVTGAASSIASDLLSK